MRVVSYRYLGLVFLIVLAWSANLLVFSDWPATFLPVAPWLRPVIWRGGLVLVFSGLLVIVLFQWIWKPWQITATRDGLTGVLRPEAFWSAAQERYRLAARYHDALGFAYVDLNAFKTLNDTFGHAAGDAALRTFGSALREVTRATDVVGRLGGDEFGWVFWRTSPQDIACICDRVRALCGPTDHHPAFTFSVGVAFVDDAATQSLGGLARAADHHLYEAKATAHTRG